MQAPGEGEAMCAALNAAGLVHACATCDGDVLLFGAQTTFHTLKLQVRLRSSLEVSVASVGCVGAVTVVAQQSPLPRGC